MTVFPRGLWLRTEISNGFYMLFTAMLIGLQWHKDNIQKTVH
ncbi:hypothetical protein [Pleurocapsa sp. FMAR1]|nr:hypothetical protein [Pleurocapsa sp. FMAR1]